MQQSATTHATTLATAVRAIATSYVADTRDPATNKQMVRPRGKVSPISVRALEEDIASALTFTLGPRSSRYKLKVSAGQPDRRYVLIPYAMLLRTDVTSTPRTGVYIALLFNQDGKNLWLTLNQGLLQFESRFNLRRSREYLKSAAAIIGKSLDVPTGFRRKSANLGASTLYGKGYEQGAILSKHYDAMGMTATSASQLLSDIQALLDLYDRLPAYALRDPSAAVMDTINDSDEEEYQQAANRQTRRLQLLNDRPRPLSKSTRSRKQTESWARNVNVAREALMRANYHCEGNCTNERFKTADGKHLYCEAHHLIPMARQTEFNVSLDVVANIVCLCPSCHAKAHRAHKQIRDKLILQLFEIRKNRLVASGLEVTPSRLLAMYSL